MRDGVYAYNWAGPKESTVLKYDNADRVGTKACPPYLAWLDQLVTAISPRGSDSAKGRFIRFETETLGVFGGKERLKARAQARLSDANVAGELRYIYSAIESGKRVYLIDGSFSND